MTPFLGQIQPFGFNFAPRGWTLCNGQLLAISSYTALFSLLGTTYGGDGRTTFGIPDLRGRSIVHPGNGPGLSPISWGQRAGAETVTLTTNHMPAHTHGPGNLTGVVGVNNDGSEANGTVPGQANNEAGAANAAVTINGGQTSSTGNGQFFNIRNPFLGVYVSIALEGVYPSRN